MEAIELSSWLYWVLLAEWMMLKAFSPKWEERNAKKNSFGSFFFFFLWLRFLPCFLPKKDLARTFLCYCARARAAAAASFLSTATLLFFENLKPETFSHILPLKQKGAAQQPAQSIFQQPNPTAAAAENAKLMN